MPNWCGNSLTITGTADQLQTFHTNNVEKGDLDSNEDRLDFNASIPMPEELKNDGDSWYIFNTMNWGTKWNAQNTSVSYNWENKGQGIIKSITYDFDTAWGPPMAWISTTASFYPDIQFELKYEEPNMDFSGILIIKDKEVLASKEGTCGEYHGFNYHH